MCTSAFYYSNNILLYLVTIHFYTVFLLLEISENVVVFMTEYDRMPLFVVIMPKPPPSKLAYKRHVLGMSTSPQNDSCRLKLYHLSCTLVTNTHPKYHFQAQFLGACKPLHRNFEISHGCTLRDTDSCLLFQAWSKSMQGKCHKGSGIVLVTGKNNAKLQIHILG